MSDQLCKHGVYVKLECRECNLDYELDNRYKMIVAELKAENKKLREALEEVARESIELECGKPYWIARKTLEELK